MAGLAISATWHSGPISAWFDATVDFFVFWQPFHYEASTHINLGASFSVKVWFVHVSVTIHVGVDLNIWGPPFGGKAVIQVSVISFTIEFGAKQEITPVDWGNFKDSFLPVGPEAPASCNAFQFTCQNSRPCRCSSCSTRKIYSILYGSNQRWPAPGSTGKQDSDSTE